MNIPSYPLFEPLKKEHKPLFEEIFKNNPPEASEFTFTNLYSWRQAYGFEVSMLDSSVILKSRKSFFIPLGKDDPGSAIKRVLKEQPGIFIRVPEAVKILFDNDPEVAVELDRDNSDYLFKMNDLVSLEGRKYDGKRNLIKKFRQEHEYRFIAFNASDVSRCLDFEEKWCSIKDCDSVEGLDNERRAIKDMVSNFSEFKLIAGAIEINPVRYQRLSNGVNSAILALAIGERLNLDTLVMHVLKADPNMPGLYQVMMHEFLEKSCGVFEYVNLEQDLGIEGLRKSKESYHPVRMINKYTIGPKK